MAIAIDKEIMTKVLHNSDFVTEAYNTISAVVDKELEKEDNEIDFDLIDECTQAILALKLKTENPASVVFPLVSSQKFLSKMGEIGWRSLSKGARIVLIAAAVFAATITASAAVGNITGNNIFENLVPETKTTETVSSKSDQSAENEKEIDNSKETTENNQAHSLVDESIVVSKAQGAEKGRFACYETQGKDEFNPKCHFERISYDSDNAVEYPLNFKEKVSNKNTAFNESDYKKKNCENSVCNTETGELHNFTEWSVTKEPTCTELGEQMRICLVCSQTQTCPVKATGEHDYYGYTDKHAYMGENSWRDFKMYDGRIKYECRLCSDKKTKTIAKAKYIVIDQYEFEYDGKAHRPKVYAVLDRNKKVIPKSEYKIVYNDNGGAKDIYNDNGVYAELRGVYYAQDIEIRFRVIPDSVKLTGVLTGNGTIVPTWKKAKFTKNVDKAIYEIQYSKNSNFSGGKTVKAYGNAEKTVISDVEKGETYYVRIRGVSDFSRNRSIPKGHWSEVRKIKVK